ncbi:MAG: type II toxin-antitoxin system VapC family toxin [Verrucomicrobiota bacterium]
MLFDTDIFIWVQRGSASAARAIDRAERRCISAFSYMEFIQGAKNKQQRQLNQQFLRDLYFETLPLTENIGHRAAIYVEQFGLSHHMRAGDAIIAATAAENGLTLATGNARHYRQIPDIQLKILRP